MHALPLLRVHEVAAAPLHRVRPVLALGDDGLAPEAAREVEPPDQVGDERHAAALRDVPEANSYWDDAVIVPSSINANITDREFPNEEGKIGITAKVAGNGKMQTYSGR